MGEEIISLKKSPAGHLKFVSALVADIESLEYMIQNGLFEQDKYRIGAEQELCIVLPEWQPADNAIHLLAELNDPSFTTELAKYNIEINLEPLELSSGCFSKMETSLLQKYLEAGKKAALLNSKIVMAGILPTISRNELSLDYLTPIQRYFHLSKKLRNMRGRKFDLYLKGVDEIHIRHDSIMFEACNTSFQPHLQIPLSKIVQAYNWAQVISAPLLAVSSNSPLLLGKELLSESRIALFQQSIDTRHSVDEIRDQRPRVAFGTDWVHESVAEIFREDVTRFEVLINDGIKENSAECLRENKIPHLYALRMNNGTIYRWNRLCYGLTGVLPHLRIECRYMPAGPSIRDEIANQAFWTGLMYACPEDVTFISKNFEFKDIKSNFFKAARTGIESIFIWKHKEISAKELIENELLPLAYSGLLKCGLDEKEIFLYLGTIEKRMKTQTGAQWQINNFRKLINEMDVPDALKIITAAMHEYQQFNTPVCDWKNIDIETVVRTQMSNMQLVKQLMSTDVMTVYSDDPATLVDHIMQWSHINHIVVEDRKGKIQGVITSGHIRDAKNKKIDLHNTPVKKIMKKDILTIQPEANIAEALKLMRENQISSLPVILNNKLMGIITKNDMLRWMQLHPVKN